MWCTALSINKKMIICNNYFESRNKHLTGWVFISSLNWRLSAWICVRVSSLPKVSVSSIEHHWCDNPSAVSMGVSPMCWASLEWKPKTGQLCTDWGDRTVGGRSQGGGVGGSYIRRRNVKWHSGSVSEGWGSEWWYASTQTFILYMRWDLRSDGWQLQHMLLCFALHTW